MNSNKNNHEFFLQVTSGRGPEECQRVVARVVSVMIAEARQQCLWAEVKASVRGHLPGTLLSSLVFISGREAESFIHNWTGVILWIAASPYRKFHKRKLVRRGVGTPAG